MAGGGTNNESRNSELQEKQQQQPHSRVGGQLECNGKVSSVNAVAVATSPEPRNNNLESREEQLQLCRYATAAGMSFVEICQVIF